ncbi:MAG: prolipoprotein diacylglyceryl transferase [Actinomycetota bacterium]|nr:prolipoprotein diacylglyceryl transferase [Actinomycetota bacterium]
MLADVEILGVSIQMFGLFFALSFLAWGAVASRRLGELDRPSDWAYELVFVTLAGGLVGAKLYWAVDTGAELSFAGVFGGNGLTWYGGLLGGALAVLAWVRWRGMDIPHLADIAAIGLPLGYAIGRIGCQISGDGDYGVPSGLPWAMPYPDGVVPTDVAVHPTPIYETLAMGLLAYVLWRLRDRFRPGVLFGVYLLAAGLERLLIEFVRRNEATVAGLTQAQVLAIASMILGAALLAVMARRRGGLVAAT